MAGFFSPALGTMGKIAGQAGGTAAGLARQPTPGVGNVRATLGQLLAGPDFAMPGGGSFDTSGGPLGQVSRTGIPAATLGLYQAQPAYLQGLAGVEEGATKLGAEQQQLQQGFRGDVGNVLTRLLGNLGFSGTTGALGGGTFALLTQLLGI